MHAFELMVSFKGNDIASVPLRDVVGKRKTVDPKFCEVAKVFFG